MKVGSVREKIIVALLICKFDEANVETEIPITEPEVDVKLFVEPVSIKTITGKSFGGAKLIWTVDAQKAKELCESYYPIVIFCLFKSTGTMLEDFILFPLEVQKRLFDKIGRENYIKLPKPGTNQEALKLLKKHYGACQII